MPNGAVSNGCSFSSRECGAWSVAMKSIAPLRSASISAWRSSSARSGGFILKFASSERTASSVSVRWCGETSAVICDAGLLGLLDRDDRLARRDVLDVDPAALVAGDRGVAGDHRRLGDRRDAADAEQRATPRPRASRRPPTATGPPRGGRSAARPAAGTGAPGAARRRHAPGRPSSVKPKAPASASSAISVSCSPLLAARDRGHEAGGDARLGAGALAQRLRRSTRSRRPGRCWAGR